MSRVQQQGELTWPGVFYGHPLPGYGLTGTSLPADLGNAGRQELDHLLTQVVLSLTREKPTDIYLWETVYLQSKHGFFSRLKFWSVWLESNCYISLPHCVPATRRSEQNWYCFDTGPPNGSGLVKKTTHNGSLFASYHSILRCPRPACQPSWGLEIC